MLFVHPYDDPAIIAGHGTVGLEFVDDFPDLTHVFMSIGGGGFIAGSRCRAEGEEPCAHVYGVETTGAQTMTEALKAGAPVTIRGHVARPNAWARRSYTDRTLAATKQFVERIIVVEDEPVVEDLVWLLQTEKVLCEPAAACVLTAAQSDRPNPAGRRRRRPCALRLECGTRRP